MLKRAEIAAERETKWVLLIHSSSTWIRRMFLRAWDSLGMHVGPFAHGGELIKVGWAVWGVAMEKHLSTGCWSAGERSR